MIPRNRWCISISPLDWTFTCPIHFISPQFKVSIVNQRWLRFALIKELYFETFKDSETYIQWFYVTKKRRVQRQSFRCAKNADIKVCFTNLLRLNITRLNKCDATRMKIISLQIKIRISSSGFPHTCYTCILSLQLVVLMHSYTHLRTITLLSQRKWYLYWERAATL